jgi:serine O-acetyltransferase
MARTHSAAGRRDTSRLQAEAGSGKFLDIMSGGKDPQVTPEERVLSLVGKLNETTARNDFISPLWETIKYEASVIVEGDLKAATILANSVLSQPSFEDAVIDLVANHLESPLLQATQIKNLFREICEKNETLQHIWASDILATTLRDSSQPNAISVLLFDQGFHSLVTYRFANCLWYSGRDGLSLFFQSLASRLFGSDIHPACQIGHSCVVACGTGVVIGETARIGNDCFVGHGVTLGGTGKESGDRHPKIGNGETQFTV